MIASAHFAAGALSGMLAGHFGRHAAFRAVSGFALGLISHFILDRIPHGDYGELGTVAMIPIVLLEVILCGLVFTRVLRDRVMPGWRVPIAAGLVGACIPDIKFPAALLLPHDMAAAIAIRGEEFHAWFHASPTSVVVGTATELLAVAVMVALLAAFPRRASS